MLTTIPAESKHGAKWLDNVIVSETQFDALQRDDYLWTSLAGSDSLALTRVLFFPIYPGH